jgi:hypothetical protein
VKVVHDLADGSPETSAVLIQIFLFRLEISASCIICVERTYSTVTLFLAKLSQLLLLQFVRRKMPNELKE